MEEFLQAHIIRLFYRVDDCFESLRIIHGEVSKNLAVETNVLLCNLTHKLRVSHTVLTCGSVDSLNPKCAEFAFLVLAVTIGVSQTFLVGVLRYRPDIFFDRKLPRVLLRIFLRRALEATEFTDLGII